MPVGELLDFERARPRHPGANENAIIDTFGIRPARYYRPAFSVDHILIEE